MNIKKLFISLGLAVAMLTAILVYVLLLRIFPIIMASITGAFILAILTWMFYEGRKR